MTVRNNLTRDEAHARGSLLDVDGYTISLDLTDGSTGAAGERVFRSVSEIRFRCAEPGRGTFVEVVADSVHAITLNGVEVDPADVVATGRLDLADLAADNVLVVDVDCLYTNTGEGLHRFVDPVDSAVYLYSQFETADAKRMYACFDQPDLKGTFDVTVTAPAGWEVVTNAATAGTAVLDSGAVEHSFETTARMSTYVTALVAGPYHVVRDSHDGIPLGLFCRASLAEHLDAEELFAVTKQGFDYFHQVFDYRYPFGKYDQLFVPEFNAGAMENAGAVTFLEDYVFRARVTDASYERRAETVLHEMAHMWFGDLVTMRWWDDLWLNESFATFMSVLCQAEATRWTHAWATFANVEKTWAYRQDQLPSTHPIAADIVDIEAVEVNFDGITYAKGASVLKQLVAYVGRDQFLEAMRTYFQAHEFANASLADLLGELEKASGRDLSEWSAQWLQTTGVAILRPVVEVGPDGRYTSFAVAQEAVEAHPTLREHRLAIGLYDRTDDGLVRRHRVELDVAGPSTDVPELLGQLRADLVLVNDDDLTYAKIRLDEHSLETLRTSVGELRDPLPRALCWAAAWDMARDAEMSAGDYLEIVLAGIDRETDIGVVQSLLRQASSAVLLFGDPALADTRGERLAARCHELLVAAEPGSDRQLAFTRAWIGAARGADTVATLRAWLAGDSLPEGLALDVELRWAVVVRLAALGELGLDEIDAEKALDPTAAGDRHAAAALAARPDPAAKAEAWAAVVESSVLPNAVQGAMIGGFAQPGQLDLVRPYVERYLAAVEHVWADRTSEMAQQIVVGLFPALLPEPEVVAQVDEWLAQTTASPGLRRLVLEGRDGLARALRARERDSRA